MDKKRKISITVSQSKDLVVFGTNLASSVGYGRFSVQISNMVVLHPYLYSVVVGLLLSDGVIIYASSTHKNARLVFKQSLANSKYVLFVFNLLSHYCSSYPFFSTSRRKGIETYCLVFNTRSLLCFSKLHSVFYPKKVKVIPENIYELLTPVALAHMIMGDGSYKSKGVAICTDCFSIQDVVRIMNVLVIRYGLICTIHTPREGQYRIYISRKSIDKLVEIIKPHMTPSMFYKIGL